MRAAIYARVSTLDQEPENQLQELRRYVEARSWTAVEFVDRGVSGSKDRRPVLDALIKDAKRRRFDVLICWRLDRLGRNLRHLITLLDELQVLGVAFVSLAEGIERHDTGRQAADAHPRGDRRVRASKDRRASSGRVGACAATRQEARSSSASVSSFSSIPTVKARPGRGKARKREGHDCYQRRTHTGSIPRALPNTRINCSSRSA